MSSSKLFTQAICLRQSDWSETSQLATLLTREHGVVRGIAKGSHRWNAPFSGGLEVLTRGEVGLFIKPARELQLISEWDLQETFPAGRHVWRTHCMHLLAVEVALRLVPSGPESQQPFESLLSLLRQLEMTHTDRLSLPPSREALVPVDLALASYVWRMLELAGHAPDLETAPPGPVSPALKPLTTDIARFAPELGRWLSPAEKAQGVWAMRSETVRVLRHLAAGTDNDRAQNASFDVASVERASRFLIAFLEYVSGQEIRTLPALYEDNPT
jgi:recombinational DNA repair protein (RecF pathway)